MCNITLFWNLIIVESSFSHKSFHKIYIYRLLYFFCKERKKNLTRKVGNIHLRNLYFIHSLIIFFTVIANFFLGYTC